MNPIDALFRRLCSQGRRAFIPFLTAGDPDLAGTAKLVEEAARRGASLIEIGFPYSDPIADGPVIQASYTRALAKGVRVADVFGCICDVAKSPALVDRQVPLVGMTSYTLVHHCGVSAFLSRAQTSGLSGLTFT